ncbi:hypothetical protein [Spongiactinospora sp. TRM90649]|nr:hypothetical protein [Spongiactinospora sp. TRM90649]MDF5758837.1 hypothetical protein [Spongiactinospora sp. TRM90649]
MAEDGALLVRPDHMIAWRAQDSGDAPAARLTEVTGRLLGREKYQGCLGA